MGKSEVSGLAFPVLTSPFPIPTSAFAPQWVGRRSNPRLRLFRPPLNRLSYRPDGGLRPEALRLEEEVFLSPFKSQACSLKPINKKARCLCDTGLYQPFRPWYGQVSQAQTQRYGIIAERLFLLR